MNCNEMDLNLNYLITSEEDELWGLTVTTVGHQKISQTESYPPSKHPSEYYF